MLKKLVAIKLPIGAANTNASVNSIGVDSNIHLALPETLRIANLHIYGDIGRAADCAEPPLVVGNPNVNQSDGSSELDHSSYSDNLGAAGHAQIINSHVNGRHAVQQLGADRRMA